MSETIERWPVQKVAEFLGVSPKHTREAITTKPDFPAPVINVSRRMRFWNAEDVKRWAAAKH